MKILITGGTVFASRYLAEYFVKKGHDVSVINRNTRPQSLGVHLIQCDRHDLGDRLKNLHFDLIIDTGYDETDAKCLVTALGSFHTYVFISSSAVYPETLPQPFHEQQLSGANLYWGVYGTNKIAAENYLLKNVPNVYILRPPYLYGAMNNLYREAFVFECAEKNLPFHLPKDGKMPLTFFHIEDLCRFIEILVQQTPKQKIFNVGNDEVISIAEWVKLCYSVVGKTPEMRHCTGYSQRDYFCFHDYAYVLDVTAQNCLMPDQKPMYDGLRESYEWYKENRHCIQRKNYLEFIQQHF